MVTNQIMLRQLEQYSVKQRTEDKYFCATDLLNLYNTNNPDRQKRLYDFQNIQDTQEFCEALSKDLNSNNDNIRYLVTDLIQAKRGKVNGGTWMHPYVFIKFAMWLSKDLEVKVIKWIYDNLIDFRNEAGDHYKEMCKAIVDRYKEFFDKNPDPLVFIKEANYLNDLVGIYNGSRNLIPENKLKLLSELQKANIKLIKDGLNKIERWKKLRDFAYLLEI